MTTTPTLTHEHECYCGKPAKKHLTRDDGTCGNVCGVHGRKATEDRAIYICRGCGEHGAHVMVFGLARLAPDAGDWHRACHVAYQDARSTTVQA